MAEPIKVEVPDQDYRMNQQHDAAWVNTGLFLDRMRDALGRDMAFSLILSRISREIRREHGVEGARKVFQGMADTVDQAALGDR